MDGSVRAVDVGHDWVVVVDVSGVMPDTLDVRVRSSVLRVEGRRRMTMRTVTSFPVDPLYGRFLRLMPLPPNVDGSVVQLRLQGTWLEVRVPNHGSVRRGIW